MNDLRLFPLHATKDLSDRLELLEANPSADPILAYAQACSALYEINACARELEISGALANQIIEAFTRVRRIMALSPLGSHMQTWPDGRQGDFGIVEDIASGVNRATPGTFAFNLERAMLDSGIVQQHRYKLRCQTEAFLRSLSAHQLRPRLLSVGCGGCRDLLPLLPTLRHFEGELILNDIDPAALELASKRLSPATKRFRMLHTDVLSAIRSLRHDKPFDLVVAGGLCDYIPDRVLILVLEIVFHYLLAPGGVFFFTNIAAGNPFRPLMSYAVNWRLIERSENDLRRLCENSSVPERCIEIEREESQLTWIVQLRRSSALGTAQEGNLRALRIRSGGSHEEDDQGKAGPACRKEVGDPDKAVCGFLGSPSRDCDLGDEEEWGIHHCGSWKVGQGTTCRAHRSESSDR